MPYMTDVGPDSGPILYGTMPTAIAVLAARDDPTQVGVALAAGRRADGLQLWRVTIDRVELPGLFIVVDREFRPAQ
jgi:hypothetical protein